MNHTAVIELSGVGVAAGDAPERLVVRDVDWAIGPGEFWVVGGDPGCGKTLLLATAAGLQPPAAGTVRIFGRALAGASEAEQVDWRRRIGFVFEHDGRLFNRLTVAENVALPLRYHFDLDGDEARARVTELLALTELSGHADVSPSRVSPRLQNRVSLARALAVPTQVLFLDDPLGGLAPVGIRWWRDLLRKLHAEQRYDGAPLTIVVSTDELAGWQGVATRFALIEQGRLRMVGGG